MGQVGGGYLGWSTIVYMSSGMFRGKESSNRIEISWLVQDLLNFGVLGSLQLWRGDRCLGGVSGCLGASGAWGMSPHTNTCTHTYADTHKYMYRNCKWLPTWRHPCLSCLTCMCMSTYMCVHVYACVCMCMHVCVHGTLPYTSIPTPTPIHPSATPQGGHPESVKIE